MCDRLKRQWHDEDAEEMNSLESVRSRRVSIVALACAGALFFGVMCSTPARAARIEVSLHMPELVNGVDASFGFVMEWTPAKSLARSGDKVTIAYSPTSSHASIIINIADLLTSAGVPSDLADLLAGVSTIDITDVLGEPIDTPIGSYEIYSIGLYVPGVSMNVYLNGQVNATLGADAGTLDNHAFSWSEWGGREASLTAPSTGTATVTASFKYWVSIGFSIAHPLGFFIQNPCPIANFSLGELSFPQTASSTVEVVDSGAGTSGLSSIPIVVAAVVGLAVGVVVGRMSRRKAKRSQTPPPDWTPPPPG